MSLVEIRQGKLHFNTSPEDILKYLKIRPWKSIAFKRQKCKSVLEVPLEGGSGSTQVLQLPAPLMFPGPRPRVLQVEIFQADGLMAKDEVESCSPFCLVGPLRTECDSHCQQSFCFLMLSFVLERLLYV